MPLLRAGTCTNRECVTGVGLIRRTFSADPEGLCEERTLRQIQLFGQSAGGCFFFVKSELRMAPAAAEIALELGTQTGTVYRSFAVPALCQKFRISFSAGSRFVETSGNLNRNHRGQKSGEKQQHTGVNRNGSREAGDSIKQFAFLLFFHDFRFLFLIPEKYYTMNTLEKQGGKMTFFHFFYILAIFERLPGTPAAGNFAGEMGKMAHFC